MGWWMGRTACRKGLRVRGWLVQRGAEHVVCLLFAVKCAFLGIEGGYLDHWKDQLSIDTGGQTILRVSLKEYIHSQSFMIHTRSAAGYSVRRYNRLSARTRRVDGPTDSSFQLSNAVYYRPVQTLPASKQHHNKLLYISPRPTPDDYTRPSSTAALMLAKYLAGHSASSASLGIPLS